MTEKWIKDMFKEAGAIITNSHIVYTSGKHGTAYVNKDAIYPDTWKIHRLCDEIAVRFFRDHSKVGDNPNIIIAPAVGGVILSQWTTHHMEKMYGFREKIQAIYADKTDKGFEIKRGYDKLISGKKVLIVEDVLNTGGSVKKVIEAVDALQGDILGVSVLCNRGGLTADDLGVPVLYFLMNIQMDAWDEKDCPLCKQGIPINTDVGKGREYLAKKEKS